MSRGMEKGRRKTFRQPEALRFQCRLRRGRLHRRNGDGDSQRLHGAQSHAVVGTFAVLEVKSSLVLLRARLPEVSMGVVTGSDGFVRLRMFQTFDRDSEIETADGEAKQKQGPQANGSLQNGMPVSFPPTAALES